MLEKKSADEEYTLWVSCAHTRFTIYKPSSNIKCSRRSQWNLSGNCWRCLLSSCIRAIVPSTQLTKYESSMTLLFMLWDIMKFKQQRCMLGTWLFFFFLWHRWFLWVRSPSSTSQSVGAGCNVTASTVMRFQVPSALLNLLLYLPRSGTLLKFYVNIKFPLG